MSAFAAIKKQFIAVDHRGASGGEMAGFIEAVVAFFEPASGENLRILRADDLPHRIGRRDVRVAARM